jgi:hypothetical protein
LARDIALPFVINILWWDSSIPSSPGKLSGMGHFLDTDNTQSLESSVCHPFLLPHTSAQQPKMQSFDANDWVYCLSSTTLTTSKALNIQFLSPTTQLVLAVSLDSVSGRPFFHFFCPWGGEAFSCRNAHPEVHLLNALLFLNQR